MAHPWQGSRRRCRETQTLSVFNSTENSQGWDVWHLVPGHPSAGCLTLSLLTCLGLHFLINKKVITGSHDSELSGWRLAFLSSSSPRLQSSLFALPWGVLPAVEKVIVTLDRVMRGARAPGPRQAAARAPGWVTGPTPCLSRAQPLSGWSRPRPSFTSAFLSSSGRPGLVTVLSELKAELG